MKVLVGCEYSGVIRDAFSRKGWDSWSCDLFPTESELTKSKGKHYQCDIFEVLYQDWDLLIAHPPCTYLSYAGTSSWNNPGRILKRLEALDFFRKLWEAPIPHICLENPRSCASPVIAKYSQHIEPYYFGDPYLKATWLWLKNLPLLKYGDGDMFSEKTTMKPESYFVSGQSNRKLKNGLKQGIGVAKERSKTFPGIANAMADQWTEYIYQQQLKLQ